MNRIQVPIFELKNIRITYGERVALKIGKFQFHRATIYGVTGAVGSGKSTLTQLLAGKITPSEGELLYESNPFGTNWRGKIRVPDEIVYANGSSISSRETVGAFLAARYSKRHREIRKQYYSNNSAAGEWDMPIVALSPGQMSRLALVSALEVDPKVLIIDDYGIHFDDYTAREFNKKLSHASRRRGVTVILSNSRERDLRSVAGVILSLDNGHLSKVRSYRKKEQRPRKR